MKEQRWLLPFTHGVNMQAIDYAVSLAQNARARLVAVSLVSVPQEPRSSGARLEHIQQSKDFLEAVKWKARRYSVPVECYEVFTVDIMQSLSLLVDSQHCDNIFLVIPRNKDVLLEAPLALLVLIRLPVQTGRTQVRPLITRVLLWLQSTLAMEKLSWIRTEEHRRE